jgi:predicted DNA-binding transcriptional regulator YafY
MGSTVKINRLFEMTAILVNRGKATARELADRFGVSTRTIYRDIDVLSLSGVPVYTDKGSGGGIFLPERYVMNKALISDQERESLLVAIKTLQATQYPKSNTLLEKVGALFKGSSDRDCVEVDFSSWGSPPNERNKFNDIKSAMLQHRVIRFDYVDGDGEKSTRLAEPSRLVFKGNAWYLLAYCRQRREGRTFRISRLKNLEVMTETFERRLPPNLEIEDSEHFSESLVHLRLRFQARVLSRLYDYFNDSFITKSDDGTFVVDVSVPRGEWVYSYILSFGDCVEVLEPDHVRKVVTERMRQALENYESSS